jgi:hypothetical protein
MKQYKIFKHPSGKTETVKQGWSWPAFFFGFIWALVKKMWWLGGGLLLGAVVLALVMGTSGGSAGDVMINITGIIVNIIFGVYGNSWREKNLVARGFEQLDEVTAANPESAVARYLNTEKTEH